MSIRTASVNEDKRRDKSSPWGKTLRISLKQLVALLLILAVALTLFFWASDRIDTHKRWASMMEISQRFMIHFDEVYVRLPDEFTNESYPTHFWIRSELDYAHWVMLKLIRLDEAHSSQLFKIENLIDTLRDPTTDTVRLNESQFSDLRNAIYTIAQKLPDAYWNPLNGTDVNSETGPSFWYFGPSPPDEVILQQVATLAIHAKAIISP
jgi:hypothetical protein